METAPARRVARLGGVDLASASWLLIAGLLVLRVVLSVVMIGRPGLQYDETLFVNAATLRIPGMFIAHSLGGVPLMVFPYIGALKSWLYAPVFSVFGTSAASIRVPVVLITSAGLALVYFAVRDLVNRPVALLAFAALCFDNSVFWLTRDDVGPTAIELFCKCALLWFAARFARAPSKRWLGLGLATLALGLFNKLNFIWTVNAVAVVSLLVLIGSRAQLRRRLDLTALWVGGLAVIYACFVAYYLANHIGTASTGSTTTFSLTWPQFKSGTELILSGTWFYDYALGPLGVRETVVWTFLGLFAVGGVAGLLPGRTRNLPVAALALVTVLIAAQNLVTAQATAGWHYISIYPFVSVVAAYGAYAAAVVLLRRPPAVVAAMTCVGAVVLVYDGVLLVKYLNDLSSREPAFSAWSPAVYALSRDVQHTKGTVFTADWGISNPLFALHPSPRYDEIAFTFGAPTPGTVQATERLLASTSGPKLVVTHAPGRLVFPQANANLFRYLGKHLQFAGAVNGLDGRPVYETYRYR